MRILSFLFLLFFLAGCSDSNNATTATSGGATGDLLGTMQLTDHRGRVMSDGSGVTVQVEGTSFSAVSDVNGNWVIHNLPTKTYAITFSKPNFYTRKNPSYTFVGGQPTRYRDPSTYYAGNAVLPTSLGELPQFTVTLDAVTMPTRIETVDALNRKIITYAPGRIFAHTSDNAPDSIDVGAYIIISKKSDLQIENTSNYLLMIFGYSKSFAATDTTINIAADLSYQQLQSYGIQPTDVVYFKAYPVVTFPYQFNLITNTTEYIGYAPTPSNVLSAPMQ